ncbi:MAG TPA: ParB/RepB/Spo0J family partition protein [Fibrobacteria bacterium]|nr:ParB/RepB/Spo0J family partition protein [Fibrobacteria bacterium]
MTRKALGKGLEAIFGNLGQEVVHPKTGSATLEIEISKITPNPFQPRTEFGPEEIQELANSIREKGLLQPILLRKHHEGYQIVAGERRFRAMQLLGRTLIPALVREQLSDRDMMEMALIENIQRVQLNAIEEAMAFEQLINTCGITHDELAQKLGKSRSAITNTLRLLKLDDDLKVMIKEGKLTAGHGRALLQTDPKKRAKLAQKIVDDHLNVRRAEKSGGRGREARGREARLGDAAKPLNPNAQAFLEKLRFLLGTKVTLKGNENRGVLEIHYMHRQDLEGLADMLERGQLVK